MASIEPAPSSLDALIALLRNRSVELSPQLQQAARYLLDHPTRVPIQSMRQVAGQAGVRPATMVRLARRLGFDGWPALRALFSEQLRVVPDSYTERARALIATHSDSAGSGALDTRAQSENLLSLEVDNVESFPVAVQMLEQAKRVIVAGFRSSYPIAYSLRYLYSLFRPDVYLLDSSVGALDNELRHLRDSDVVVAISYAPYTHEMVDVTRAAVRHRSQIIAISDSRLSPVASDAACVLMFRTKSTSFFPSTVAAQALVELLAQRLLVHAGVSAVDDLERAETELRKGGAYL